MLSRREGAAVKTESIVGCDLFATALASASFSAAPRAARTAGCTRLAWAAHFEQAYPTL